MLCLQAFTHHGGPCVTPQTIPQTVSFRISSTSPSLPRSTAGTRVSDGGAVCLKAAERVYGLVAGFARCLVDRRELGKIRHTLTELLGQRIFGIACGHPDGNDADHLADDPIHKLLLGRDPSLARRWPRSRRSRGSRTALAPPPSMSWRASWRCGHRAASAPAGRAGAADHDRPGSRPTTRRTAPSSSPSSTGITIAGATCRCWRF